MAKLVKKSIEERRKPMTHEKIYKIMVWVTFIVAGAFLVINLVKFNVPGIIAIGGSMLVLAGILFALKKMAVRVYTRELALSIALEGIIFAISLFSGESYSDDFPLFLAAIGMSGMYMEPKFTKIQIIVADVLLALMYLINPDKGGALGQYILCAVMFTLAGALYCLTITRGRAFIDIADKQASASNNLLWTMQEMGEKLEKDFDESSARIADSTQNLENGSALIITSTEDVSDRCALVQDKIRVTGKQIENLNKHVKVFEDSLSENTNNMEAMRGQLQNVNDIIERTSSAVNDMKQQMNEVASIAEQLGTISFKTTLLSLNASVEASHAGAAGQGFAVVASEMKELSEISERFAERVAEVVSHLLGQVERISDQFGGSTAALKRSENKMTELQGSFTELTKDFETLYDNIGEQTRSVEDVDEMFAQLREKIAYMKNNSSENKETVNEIIKAMDEYRENIAKVIVNTRVKENM